MKILHLPTSVAGQAFALSQAERALGMDSDYLLMFRDKYYPDIPAMFDVTPQSPIISAGYLPKLMAKIREIAASDYDILHFNFSRSLLDYPGFMDLMDLDFYPQRIFVTFNGCDARLRSAAQTYSPCSWQCESRVCWQSDRPKQARIDKWRGRAEKMFVSTPDLLRSVPDAKFIPNTVYGWDKLVPVKHEDDGGPLTVIHAPTNRHIKGTDIIEKTVAELMRDYPHDIRLVTIEGKTRDEALALYRQADVAIDQLRLGWYGVFAIECMKMGIPVIAYCRYGDMRYIHPWMAHELDSSILNATPDTVYGLLRHLIHDRELLEEKRYLGMRFADKWHAPEYVAGLLKEEYKR